MRGLPSVLAVCALAVVASVPAHTTHAQPSTKDLDRARTEYAAAEAAMADGDYNLATNHYANSYRASNDPALLYKIGVARQKAGDCLNAVRLLWVFLQLGKPSDDHATLTRERIHQCGGDADHEPGPPPADPVAGWGITIPKPDVGSAEPVGSAGSGSGSAGSAAGSDAGSAEPVGSGSGSAVPPPPAPLEGRHRAAWILVGAGIAAATAGAVLAYSANASEQDVADLYVGLGGNPPRFDANTRKRFDDLVAEGNRYEKLSWVSFGVAGVLGSIAAWRFITDKPRGRVEVTPTASPTSAGISATVTW